MCSLPEMRSADRPPSSKRLPPDIKRWRRSTLLQQQDLAAFALEVAARPAPGEDWAEIPKGIGREERVRSLHVEAVERVGGFAEVDLNFSEAEARHEAERCLNCGICCECMECVRSCEAKAIDHHMPAEDLQVKVGSIIFGHRLRPDGSKPYAAVRLRRLPERLHEPRVRAVEQCHRSDRRPDTDPRRKRPVHAHAAKRRHSALHRQPGRKLPRILLAGVLHVRAQIHPPHQGKNRPRHPRLRFLHRSAVLRQRLRGVLPPLPGGGHGLHPRQGGRDHRPGRLRR